MVELRLFAVTLGGWILSIGAAAAETLALEVARAEAGNDPATAIPIVTITLKAESSEAFGRFTAERLGEPVELKIGDRTLSRPIVREPILGGILIISGSMTPTDAQSLAKAFSAGGEHLLAVGSDR